MLKQPVPPRNVDSRSGPVLPPLSTLPQWTRVNTLSKSCPPRPLMKDRLQRLPDTVVPQKMSQRTTAWDDEGSVDDAVSATSSTTSLHRVHHLEHAILFLQQQHDDTLIALHDEVDRLKRENRGAYFLYLWCLSFLLSLDYCI